MACPSCWEASPGRPSKGSSSPRPSEDMIDDARRSGMESDHKDWVPDGMDRVPSPDGKDWGRRGARKAQISLLTMKMKLMKWIGGELNVHARR